MKDQRQEIIDALKDISVRKVQHKVHSEWISSGKLFSKLVGRWHYIYSSSKGEISLIKLINYHGNGIDLWETYTLKGNLDSKGRFRSKKEAEKTIFELLR